jgi:membrane protease YdiL (CAAX protease family)
MTHFTADWTWTALDLKICLPILVTIVFFSVYWFTSKSDKIKRIFYNKSAFDQASLKHILFTKYFGFFSLGIFPTIICLIFLPELTLADLGLTVIYETTFFSIFWIFALSAVIIPLTYSSAKKPKNLVNYPQIRAKVWSKKMLFTNALGWFLYLFGYEFLFRGVLLIPLIEPLGMWPAIAINIALYSATHIPKGLDETFGAIPLGFVLCLLTLSSGTIWIAFIVHLVIGWTNSFTALKFHPDMQLQK